MSDVPRVRERIEAVCREVVSRPEICTFAELFNRLEVLFEQMLAEQKVGNGS
jgi:hypothetical protein